MGISGISPGSLLIILLILILLFGSNRIKAIAQELGSSVKSFKKGFEDMDTSPDKQDDATNVDKSSNKKST